jgi:acylphosphatase
MSDNSPLCEIECIVTGRVQMVMYRDFTYRKAQALGVVGTVQNQEDGSVKVTAQGTRENLTTLIELLNRGSVFSHVKNVDVTWREPSETFADFSIVY